jgi:hypothetical protein
VYAPDPAAVGIVPAVLPELSGLAASRRNPGVYWAHNDSGNALILFGILETGEVVARYPLEGVNARDVEDIAVGPCGSEGPSAATCVVLADVGDNRGKRTSVQLIRIPEPPAPGNGTIQVQALPFTYPDGPHDAESLIIDRTGTPYVISKTLASLGDVYRIEGLSTGRTGRAVKVAELRAPGDRDRFSTAADLHPDGERMLLRTYGHVWEYRAPGATRVEDLLSATPVEVPSAGERQGEAVAYTLDGKGYLTGSEGAGSTLHRVSCRR